MKRVLNHGIIADDGLGETLRSGELKLAKNMDEALSWPDSIVNLIQATPDQLPTSNVGSVVTTVDTAVARFTNGKSIKNVATGAATHQIRWTSGPKPTAAGSKGPQEFANASEVRMWIYLPTATDVANLSSVALYLWDQSLSSSSPDNRWIRSTADTGQPALVDDQWMLFRWIAHGGTLAAWQTTPPAVYRVDVLMVTTGDVTMHIDSIDMVQRKKASLVFVNDQSVRWFMDGTDQNGVETGGYPDFLARDWPVSFATQPGNWAADSSRPTKAEVVALADAGNEITYHSWAGEGDDPTELTADEMYDYNAKAMREIKEAGIRWFPYRGAILQNTSAALVANENLLADRLWGYPGGAGPAERDIFPPQRRTQLGRWAMHNRTAGEIDTTLANFKLTRGIWIHYTHLVVQDGDPTGIVGASAVNANETNWDYYLAALHQAVFVDQWLEILSMETLFRRYGGRYVNGVGGDYWEWPEADGTYARIPA